MRMVDIIAKKRDGQALTTAEINYFIKAYTKNEIPDYQASALLMAIYFQDMNDQERSALAMAMLHSGETIDLTTIPGIKVDKHSTGGVGDKISIPLAPLVASVGVLNPMISGRGLGHTGGTLDKLEAIPGFSVDLTEAEFIEQVQDIGVAIISTTGDLAPADHKLYALRDVTGTVESIPLIASSIMSKKIASGTQALVLDVKQGNGAFMQTLTAAQALAKALVRIGQQAGLRCVALITNMNQPLGAAIGNGIEIKESIDVLTGKGPKDVTELTLALGSYMVYLAGKTSTIEAARELLTTALNDGRGLAKFKEMVHAQGGDLSVFDHPEKLYQTSHTFGVTATDKGFVTGIKTADLGIASMLLGGGRSKKEDVIDHQVGLLLHQKVGDEVKAGDTLATIYANQADVQEVEMMVQQAFIIESKSIQAEPLIQAVIEP